MTLMLVSCAPANAITMSRRTSLSDFAAAEFPWLEKVRLSHLQNGLAQANPLLAVEKLIVVLHNHP